jgi:hypothetical protein
MKRLLVALAALALPAGAAAKELKSAAVCGPDGCTQVTENKQALVAAFEDGGPPSSPPNRDAPFYRVRIRIKGDSVTETLLVSPALRRVRGFDHTTWFAMPRRNYRTWVAVTRDVRPFPAAQLPGVDPNAPAPATGGGALPPQTYKVAPVDRPASSADDGGNGPSWWLIVAIAAAVAALGAAALRLHGRAGNPPRPEVSGS